MDCFRRRPAILSSGSRQSHKIPKIIFCNYKLARLPRNIYLIFISFCYCTYYMAGKCFISGQGGSVCDDSEVVPLGECKADISGHLYTCHLSHLAGCLLEDDLILNRGGKLKIADSHLESLHVCHKHRLCLGRKWRPPKTCQHPAHSGRKSKLKSRNAVDPERCNEIHLAFGEIVPIGSRKYRIFIFCRRPPQTHMHSICFGHLGVHLRRGFQM